MPLIEPGTVLTLDVEKATAGGRMLARHERQVVLVWGAIPGERIRARVERTGKGVLYAETIAVLSASSDRRDCHADWRCGGYPCDRLCLRPSSHWYTAGNTSRVSSVDVINPPMTTVASGLWTSAPAPVEMAIGIKPRLATRAVIKTGARRSSEPRKIIL